MDTKNTDPTNSKGQRVRNCEYEGIKLQDALKFTDEKWCNKFFKSFENMNKNYPGKMLYLEWDVYKSELPKTKVKWTLIADKKGYSQKMKNGFGSKVNKDYEPSWFPNEDAREGDIVMICPGEGSGTSTKGFVNESLGHGRCIHVTNYMCSGKTGDDEKKKLWKMVGETTMLRMEGKLERTDKYKDVDKGGHKKMTISTHGHGVPWLHVRVESNPQYPLDI